MNKRVLDILTLVIREIRENSYGDVDLQVVVDFLEDEGFSDDEISIAMSWLLDRGENLDRIIQGHTGNVPRPIWRKLNNVESDAISPNAFSYLFQLRELDLVTDSDMERIIDRAVNLRIDQLDVEDMQDLIAAVVLDFENNASTGYFQFTSTRYPH